jgi:hypothetical protein
LLGLIGCTCDDVLDTKPCLFSDVTFLSLEFVAASIDCLAFLAASFDCLAFVAASFDCRESESPVRA